MRINLADGLQLDYISRYDLQRQQKICTAELVEQLFCTEDALPAFHQAKYDVDLYRVIYKTTVPELNNKDTTASGLLAIPVLATNSLAQTEGTTPPSSRSPLAMYLHGTTFSKAEAPSNPELTMETRLAVAQYAGASGMILCCPDYIGKGSISPESDTYLIRGSTQRAVIDMLKATRTILSHLNIHTSDELFVMGWSQGGWATLVTLQACSEEQISVTAASAACAPADTYLTVSRWLYNPQPSDAEWLPGAMAIHLCANDDYLNLGIAEFAIKPEYLQLCRQFYNSEIDFSDFSDRTPHTVLELLTEQFIDSGKIGRSPYWQSLHDLQGWRWPNRTPLHVYYGENDEVVPPSIARLPEEFHALLGHDLTKAISTGQTNHREAFLEAVRLTVNYFEGFLKTKD